MHVDFDASYIKVHSCLATCEDVKFKVADGCKQACTLGRGGGGGRQEIYRHTQPALRSTRPRIVTCVLLDPLQTRR